MCLLLIVFIIFNVWHYKDLPEVIHHEVLVVDVIDKGDYQQVIVRSERHRLLINDYQKQMHIGDIYFIKGIVERFSKQTIPQGFSAYNYYASKNINGKLKVSDIRFVKHTFHVLSFRQDIIEYYQRKELSPFVYMMIFGIPIDKENTSSFELLGISHLLSVSGLHVYILILWIKKLFFELNIKPHHQDYAIGLIYVIILYVQRFDMGILRLSLLYLLTLCEKRYMWRLSYLERLNSVFFMILIFNINFLYHVGFLMSYMILTTISLIEPLYRSYSPLIKRFIITMSIILILIPFQSEIPLMAMIVMPLLGQMIAGATFITSIFVMIIPYLHHTSVVIFDSIEAILNLLSMKAFSLTLGKMNVHVAPLYYVLLILSMTYQSLHKRLLCVILTLLTVLLTSCINMNTSRIIFLDVGQGDSTIIHTKKCLIVIDAYQYVHDYLKNQGVQKIDFLILTHSDKDHIQEASSLLQSFDVNYMVLSYFDKNYPTYPAKKLYVKSGDYITCGTLKLHILAPFKNGMSDNDSSIVIHMVFDNLIYLFTGDIEAETESLLIDHYGHRLKSDVLKVSHHGSKTSSSYVFLYYVKPKFAIISVGRQNRYGFPHDEVTLRLHAIQAIIYRTDLLGSISYTPSKKKSKWDFHLPF